MGGHSSGSYSGYGYGNYFSTYARFSGGGFTSSGNYGSSCGNAASRVGVNYSLMLYMGPAKGSRGSIKSRGHRGLYGTYVGSLYAYRLQVASNYASQYAGLNSGRPMGGYSRSGYYRSRFCGGRFASFTNRVAGEYGRFVLRGVSYLVKFSRSSRVRQMGSSLHRGAKRGTQGSGGHVWGAYRGSNYRAYRGYRGGYRYQVRATTSRRGDSHSAYDWQSIGHRVHGVRGTRNSVGTGHRGSPSSPLHCVSQGYARGERQVWDYWVRYSYLFLC